MESQRGHQATVNQAINEALDPSLTGLRPTGIVPALIQAAN
jgi:hypothetical protein